MSQPKAADTTYATDWAKVKGWAAAQKIPEAAVNNVQTLDASRLADGSYAMSNAERTRAILAAAGMNYNTSTPSDNPSPTNVIGNTISNARSIFTGLMPTRLVSNLWDTAKASIHAVTDPASLEGKTLGDTIENLFDKTALSWVPGLADIGVIAGAGSLEKGLDQLAEQPLTSVLDVMPALKAVDVGIGRAAAETEMGKVLADKLQIAPKALGHQGGVRFAGKALGQIRVGTVKGFDKDAEGRTILAAPTLARRMSDRALTMGTGKYLSDSDHFLMSENNAQTDAYRRQGSDWVTAMSKLTPDKRLPDGTIERGTASILQDVMHSGRSVADIRDASDVDIPVAVKEALEAYRPIEVDHLQTMISNGMVTPTLLPDGSTAYYESTSPVPGYIKDADAAHAKADKASAASDEVVAQAKALDAGARPVMARITEIKDSIAGTVVMQPHLSKTYLTMFGRLTGKDGLLEQMQTAMNTQDWVGLRESAKKARTLVTKSVHFTGNETRRGLNELPAINEMVTKIDQMFQYGKVRVSMEKDYVRKYEGLNKTSRKDSAQYLNEQAAKADKRVQAAIRKNWQGQYRDVVLNTFFKSFMESDKKEEFLDQAAAALKAKTDPEGHHIYDEKLVNRVRRSNPKKLYELVQALADPMTRDPFMPNMTPHDHEIFMKDALDEAEHMRARAVIDPDMAPIYVPTIGAQGFSEADITDRIYVNPMRYGKPTVDAAWSKARDVSNTINDVSLGVPRMMRQPYERDVTLAFAGHSIVPMLHSLLDIKHLVGGANFEDVINEKYATAGADLMDRIQHEYGMEHYDIQRELGVKNSDLGLDDDSEYWIPSAVAKQLRQMVGKDQFPLKGAWDRSTGVFKYAILGLSPRYTAHILFGGTMLLALRIDPRSFAFIGQAAKAVRAYHKGEIGDIDSRVMQGAGQRGAPELQIQYKGMRQAGNLVIQETLAKMGIDHHVATGLQWATAAAQANFKFTNWISDIQRSIAYLDGVRKANRKGGLNDPITGEWVEMTPERAHAQGMMAAERVMGNLQAMTPLERSVARKLMPFYGWTKHILKYVLSYPVDHPWRVAFLSTLATQNSDNFASGLDQRMQLLFFLGQPDVNGNVSAVDARALDPFRDVANYASLGGWISAMNPIITAPAAYIDPEIIYGGNVLHPSITYDSVYGVNVAAAGGSQMGAAEQEIPELSLIDQALGMTAKARSIKAEGGEAKAMFQALNIPFAQVQHLNLQQISAEHEIDRYNQAANDALNAWQTGDFSVLKGYAPNAQLPDPLNKDYNTTPAQLAALYQEALKRNPGLPPSETVPDLVSPSV